MIAVAAVLTLGEMCNAEFTFLPPTPYLSAADSPFPVLTNPTFNLEDFENDDCVPGPGVFCGGEFDAPGVNQIHGNVILGSSVDADDGVIDNSGQSAFSGVAIQSVERLCDYRLAVATKCRPDQYTVFVDTLQEDA